MIKKVAIGGLVAAAVVGVGTAAMAESGSTGGTPSAASSAASGTGKLGGGRGRLLAGLAKRVVHGQFVTQGKDSTFVTHEVIRGDVTSVSATSITVKAADKTSETFTVNGDTKVRIRTSGKGAAATIGQVKDGDSVLVAGTGTGTATANYIIDAQK